MAISTNGGSNPTSVLYNGKNCTEVWYKSSPSATAIKVWPDDSYYKPVYIFNRRITGDNVLYYIVNNVEKDIYSQVVKTNWSYESSNSTSAPFFYRNIAQPGSYIEGKMTNPNVLNIEHSLKVPSNILGISVPSKGMSSRKNWDIFTIEKGYIIPAGFWYTGDIPEKIKIPDNRIIPLNNRKYVYFNGVLVSSDIEIPKDTKYVIHYCLGETLTQPGPPYAVTYLKQYYATDDYWEEKYNKEA